VRFGDRVASTLRRGDPGAFEVVVDGEVVFSKLALGRFPARGEVVAAVARRLGERRGRS
jgi:selT/selW/selH-like putative selenoprotein